MIAPLPHDCTLNSHALSLFGEVNFVLEETMKLKINKLLEDHLPSMPSQSTYNWFDIFISYWSVFICGGDCAEYLDINYQCPLKVGKTHRN